MIAKENNWKALAVAKRAAQLASIPQQWHLPQNIMESPPTNTADFLGSTDLLTPRDKFITTQNVPALLDLMRSRNATAVEVVTAFFKRVAIAQQLIRCCTEMFLDDALRQAKELDEHLARTGKVKGPLHGLPVSLKDIFDIVGQDTTVGWVGLIGKPATRDSELVQCLQSQGAVLYVKSNIPQSMMMSDSYNHVFKQSVNALNRNLISGGSSGGEAAIACMRGSPVGIGSDIGGSIRIPAALQGMYGLCPSVGRVCNEASRERPQIISPVAGPISASLDSVEAFMDGYMASEPWDVDPGVCPVPWRSERCIPPQRPLKIGYYFDDGWMKVQPPAERAVKHLVAKLKAAGHDVFPWDTSSHAAAHEMWTKCMLSDGGEKFQGLCDLVGEPLIEGMIVGTEETKLTAKESSDLHDLRTQYQTRYLRRWKESGVDALIMPVTPYIGYTPKTWIKSSQYVGYTGHWNFVDYAALAVPCIKADKTVDCLTDEWTSRSPRNASDRFNQEQYDPDLIDSMPVGAQIVGGRFGEEKCIAVAKVVRDVLAT